jgi:hypothetical protein
MCLRAARAVLKGRPDPRSQADESLCQSRRYFFRSFLVSDSQAQGRTDHQRGIELYESPTIDTTRQQAFVDASETIESWQKLRADLTI